jgi:triacylglycerol esterase/lipase EstA (alpha/beta hydrolase family)
LIWKATQKKKVHFLAMMDCCHSGSATRSMDGLRPRKLLPNHTPQTVSDYLGFKDYEKKEGRVNPPPSNHVLLAAARDNELAKEKDFNGTSRGVFTYSLLEILEDGGIHQSYQELMQRTRIKMENRTVQQHPQLEGTYDSQGFLGMKEVKGVPYLVYFDEKKKTWKADVGGLQGLSLDNSDTPLMLKLVDGKKVEVTEVLDNTSKVSGMDGMDKSVQYPATLAKESEAGLSLFLGKDVKAALAKKVKSSLADFLKIKWEKSEDSALYSVRMLGESLILTKSGEDVPVFKRVPKSDLKDFSRCVDAVAYWEKILPVNNPKTKIDRSEIDIKITVFDSPLKTSSGDKKKDFINPTESVGLKVEEVTENGETEERGQVWQVEVTNKSTKKDYFINGVYLDAAYGVNTPMNFNTNIRLEKGQTQVLHYEDEGQVIDKTEAWLDDAYLTWGVNEITDYFRIFVSTKEMERVYAQQNALPLDVKGQSADTNRGGRRPKQYAGEDWTVFDVEFKITRPFTEVKLADRTVSLQNIKITTPKGFSGKASLTNLKEVTRSLDYPLPPFFSRTNQHSVVPLTRGMQQSDGLEVLEIFETKNKDQVTPETPVTLNFEGMEMKDEVMIPWGVDAETGMFYPLGSMDEDGNVIIETLPDETPTQRTRSLGGSIKIFFQKVTKIFYEHPLLQQVEVTSRDEMTYLDKDLAAINKIISTGEPKKVAVFVHGIIGDTKEMAKAVERVNLPNGDSLNSYYDVVLTFDYENLSTEIQQTAADFKAALEKAGLGEGHGHTLHVYAHSMGGLVSRWMIEKLEGDKMVNHLFQFGTPNGGSEWSDIQEMATMLLTNAVNGAAFLQPYLLPLTLASRFLKKVQLTLGQMNPKSDFTKALNDGTTPNISYSIINGNTQLIEAKMSKKKKGLLEKVLARFKSRGHYTALDLVVFKNPNDICVTISSQSTLNDGTQFIKKIVACDHVSYFVNPVSLAALEEVVAERFDTVFS